MLDGGAHTLGLHAFDISDRDTRSEKGIFTEVLKVTSIHRRAINVHARPQKEMHALCSRISTDLSPDSLCQRPLVHPPFSIAVSQVAGCLACKSRRRLRAGRSFLRASFG